MVGERRVIRVLGCQRCGQSFDSKRSDAKWCPPCRPFAHRHVEERRRKPCPECGTLMNRKSRLCRPCANKAGAALRSGPANHNWRGGKTLADGYIYLRQQSGGGHYRGEHICVWEAANGPLPGGWVVHHLNGVKTDNRLVNLAAMPRQLHHSEPRAALRPYEARIKHLEALLQEVKSHV